MQALTLFYDGLCPLCRAEIVFLETRNQAGLLRFVDVSNGQYCAVDGEPSCAEALANMHAQFEDGRVIMGVPVFIEAYRRAGLPTVAWLMSRPALAGFWRFSYAFFARHRHSISRVFGPPLWRLAQAHADRQARVNGSPPER